MVVLLCIFAFGGRSFGSTRSCGRPFTLSDSVSMVRVRRLRDFACILSSSQSNLVAGASSKLACEPRRRFIRA
ncbi:hypothetical protein BDV96DRAFT_585343 [Lophiotrema nucula]|uniref:Secreted protein n=1 Tax=Lophiotrema nucula TaxID=690887 RepID=A0A6A5YRR1_9PLEO|nr:hypothetical protein BDV96DRAFT_585343 [Lophiotrema nucula]